MLCRVRLGYIVPPSLIPDFCYTSVTPFLLGHASVTTLPRLPHAFVLHTSCSVTTFSCLCHASLMPLSHVCHASVTPQLRLHSAFVTRPARFRPISIAPPSRFCHDFITPRYESVTPHSRLCHDVVAPPSSLILDALMPPRPSRLIPALFLPQACLTHAAVTTHSHLSHFCAAFQPRLCHTCHASLTPASHLSLTSVTHRSHLSYLSVLLQLLLSHASVTREFSVTPESRLCCARHTAYRVVTFVQGRLG
jgi:hypothetical protein